MAADWRLHLPVDNRDAVAGLANFAVRISVQSHGADRIAAGRASLTMDIFGVVNSTYNSLQLSWNRAFKGGYSFGVSYTLSKSMDNGSNYRDIVPDTYNTSNMWGPSEFDTRHVVMINYIYDLPFFK